MVEEPSCTLLRLGCDLKSQLEEKLYWNIMIGLSLLVFRLRIYQINLVRKTKKEQFESEKVISY